MQSFKVTTNRTVIVIVLGSNYATTIGLGSKFLYALKLLAESFIDLIIRVVNGLLTNHVHLTDTVIE